MRVVAVTKGAGGGMVYGVAPRIPARVAKENGANGIAKNALGPAHISEGLAPRIAALRVHFTRQSFVTNSGYRRMFNLSREGAKRELGTLVEHGYLVMEGRGRGARYLPGPALGGSEK